MALRNFIFIDKNKMYSFYSQIFEGVAESLVKSFFYSNEDKNMTGKKLEETLIEASVKVQNVVLFDHIYNSLEAKMLPNILVIDDKTTREDIKDKAEAGQMIEVSEIKTAYEKAAGKSKSHGQIYRVLHRHGWRKIKPRSRHPKKASPEAIKASKKLKHP